MNCTNLVTFILKGQQYYFYDCVVKDLPIFQELKKSDKLETIPYDHDISKDEIQYVFNIINNWKNDDANLDLQKIINIYQFMKFLTIELYKIDDFCVTNLRKIDFTESVNYCIQNNYSYDIFEMICNYCNNKDNINMDDIKKFEVDDNVKYLLIRAKIATKIADKSNCHVYYAKTNFGSNHCYYADRRKYTELRDIKKIYDKNLKTRNVKVLYENHHFKSFLVNGKPVEVCGNTTLETIDFIGINLYDTILNHISMVLLGKIDL